MTELSAERDLGFALTNQHRVIANQHRVIANQHRVIANDHIVIATSAYSPIFGS